MTSVLNVLLSILFSGRSITLDKPFSASYGLVNDGQPLPESYFVSELKKYIIHKMLPSDSVVRSDLADR